MKNGFRMFDFMLVVLWLMIFIFLWCKWINFLFGFRCGSDWLLLTTGLLLLQKFWHLLLFLYLHLLNLRLNTNHAALKLLKLHIWLRTSRKLLWRSTILHIRLILIRAAVILLSILLGLIVTILLILLKPNLLSVDLSRTSHPVLLCIWRITIIILITALVLGPGRLLVAIIWVWLRFPFLLIESLHILALRWAIVRLLLTIICLFIIPSKMTLIAKSWCVIMALRCFFNSWQEIPRSFLRISQKISEKLFLGFNFSKKPTKRLS